MTGGGSYLPKPFIFVVKHLINFFFVQLCFLSVLSAKKIVFDFGKDSP